LKINKVRFQFLVKEWFFTNAKINYSTIHIVLISKGKVSKSAHSIYSIDYRTLTKRDVQFASIQCELH